MDPNTRPIKLALLTVIGFTLLAIIGSLVVPFDVRKPAEVRVLTGSAERVITGQPPDPLQQDGMIKLEPGYTVRVLPAGQTRVTFGLNGGWAILTGPAALTLVESYRHATALGHISERFERSYVLTLEQHAGRIQYDFAQSVPPFADTEISVRLPDRHYTPNAPCWTIEITEALESQITSTDCPAPSE